MSQIKEKRNAPIRQNREKALAFLAKAARRHDTDPDHSRQVTALALLLFDELYPLHGYDAEERFLLEVAGLLHDIGWSKVVSGRHHKISRDIINDLAIPGINLLDRFTCALVARYHTKSLPDRTKHRQFASLVPERQNLVEWLAGILRVADGLDCNHRSLITGLRCAIKKEELIINLFAEGDCRVQIKRASEKQTLLEKKTGKIIVYRC
ncbi:MAG TPA: HD domain-containing protein [Smithellaceae bacterium]|nr:HD domain-containing protein [Smithellaceae bacterium]